MKKIPLHLIMSMILTVFYTHMAIAQWVQLKEFCGGDIVSLAISGSDIFAGTYRGGLFLSSNNGTSWNEINNINSVYSLAASGGNIFAGTSAGVFLSTDSCKSWTGVNTGLTNAFVNSLAVSGGTIFAGTRDNGVWRRPLSEITGPANAPPQRKIINKPHFKISSINSTGSSVTIEFTIPHPDQVAMEMYDLVGRETPSLVNQYFDAGSYRYSWNTHNLAQGCFMIRLQTSTTTCYRVIQIIH
jgi:hypothetical protein